MRAGQQLEAFSTAFGLVASAALHLAILAYVASATDDFDFDFELTLPTEVEFGVAEGMKLPAIPTPTPERPESIGSSSLGDDPSDALPDGGVPKQDDEAGRDRAAEERTEADGSQEDEPTDETVADPVSAPTLEGPSRLPPGAHLALRVDMRRIRESPLGPDVTQFLRGVPDWQLLLAGSGIDPVADLDRLLVATPNLQRSKLVVAGRHRRDPWFARQSVKRLARSRGRPVQWRRRHGVLTAPWHDRDRTVRTIALLSPQHFSITRQQDLSRVLALARARELHDAKKQGVVVARGPDALLSMGPEEAVSLEVEGVHRFVVGSVKHVPVRLRIAIRETGSNEAMVSALATYASPDDAREASQYWKKVATFYSKQLILTLAGFGKTLRRMEFEPEGERVTVSFRLDADQIRFILSYAEGRLRGAGGATQPRQPKEQW